MGFISMFIFIIMVTLIHGIHKRLLFEAQSGLDSSVIAEAFTNFPLREVFKLIEGREVAFLLFPIGLFGLLLFGPSTLKIGGQSSPLHFPSSFCLLSLFCPMLRRRASLQRSN